jgi:hypothetical protein
MSDENTKQQLSEEEAAESKEEERPRVVDSKREAMIENIIRAIRLNEKNEKKNEVIRVNYKVLIDPKTKLIAPFVTLTGTAVVAVVTYLRNFPQMRWFVTVCSTLVLFMFLGFVLQYMVEKFELDIVKKEVDDRLKKLREEEEAKIAALQAEAAAETEAASEADAFY